METMKWPPGEIQQGMEMRYDFLMTYYYIHFFNETYGLKTPHKYTSASMFSHLQQLGLHY